MSERTITLTGFALLAMRSGNEIVVADNAKRVVALRVQGRPSEGSEDLRATLSLADLDLIEQQSEGLVVADETGTTGWTVRVAS